MSRIRKGKITVLFWIYLFIVLRITVFRSTFTLQHLCRNGKIILTLFDGYIDLIRHGNWFSFTYLFFWKYYLVRAFWNVSAIQGENKDIVACSHLWIFVFPPYRNHAVCLWDRLF